MKAISLSIAALLLATFSMAATIQVTDTKGRSMEVDVLAHTTQDRSDKDQTHRRSGF